MVWDLGSNDSQLAGSSFPAGRATIQSLENARGDEEVDN